MRATKETKKKFESIYRARGYESMSDFAKAAGLNYANLSRVMSGKQAEGSIMVRIANFLGVNYNELRQRCGFCGTDGEEAFDELNQDFQAHQSGNATVVGNGNNVMNNVVSTNPHEVLSNVVKDTIPKSFIQSEILDLFSGVGGFGDEHMTKRLTAALARLGALESDNKAKEERIKQLEEDKAFLQALLEKR